MKKLMMENIRKLLLELRERIEGEDYIGTCSCVANPPKNKKSEEYCHCEKEHNEVLAKIDAGLEELEKGST